MMVINFSHPLTSEQLEALARENGQAVERVIEAPTQFDPSQPFAEQVQALADSVGLTGAEWQTLPLIVVLPSLNVIAAALLAELHGRCGYFPTVARLRPVAGSVPPRFEVAELLDLQSIRDTARQKR